MNAQPRLPAVLAALPLAAATACAPSAERASAYVIERRDQWIGGAAADAREGDLVIENGRIRAGVLSTRCVDPGDGGDPVCSSPGPGVFGGSLVDVDLRRGDAAHQGGLGEDHLAEVFGTVNLDITATRDVRVLADGADGGPAVVRTEGPAGDYISYIDLIGALLDLPDTWIVTDTLLRPQDPYLTLRTTAVVRSEEEIDAGLPPAEEPCPYAPGDAGLPCDDSLVAPAPTTLSLTEGLNAGALHFGDFFLAGGDVDVFAPGVGFDEDRAVAEGFEAGVNSIVDPFGFPFLAGTADGVSYALGTGGTVSVPIFTSSQTAVFGARVDRPVDDAGEPLPFEAGTRHTYERFLGVGRGDVGSAVDALFQAYVDHGVDLKLGAVAGRVVEEGTLAPLPGLHVLVYRDTGAARGDDGLPPLADIYSEFGTDPGDDSVPDGSFGGRLPAGDWLLVAKGRGRAPSPPVAVRVDEGATVEVGLIAPRTAPLVVDVVDERGTALPSKVSVRPAGGASAPIWSPLGDPHFGGGTSEIVFAPYGEAEIDLPPGTYDVLVTRGLEYGIWDSRVQGGAPDGVTLTPGAPVRLHAVLPREVDSTGFISADLHVHAAPSHDVGVPLELRVVTMVCEGVEFLSSNDHDVLTDYRPVIAEMGLDPWVQATVGLETTTIEVGHFLGFPFRIDYDQAQGGSFDWTAMTPAGIVEALRALGTAGAADTAVFVGHPRDGILGYFDQYGLDPYSGGMLAPTVSTPLLNTFNPLLADTRNFTLDFDAIEVLNGKRLELIRTPTQEEMDCYEAHVAGGPDTGCEPERTAYKMVERTLDEQQRLEDPAGTFTLDPALPGQIDDWFTLLNLGYRHTAIGNSDTHSTTSIEAGCPRNYIVSDVDHPELIDERDVARAVREHRVVASYGPFVDFWAEDDSHGVGSDVSVEGGSATLHLEVQAPRWMRVDRVELYENGRLVREWTTDAGDLDTASVVRLVTDMEVSPTGDTGSPADAWYVVSVLGEQDLAPVFTPVDVPPVQLDDVVVGALSGLDLGSLISGAVSAGPLFPRKAPVYPYAVTNPIWVDVDGDRDGDGHPFEARGSVPAWMRPTEEE